MEVAKQTETILFRLMFKEEDRTMVTHKPDFKAHLLGGPKVEDFSVEPEGATDRPAELSAEAPSASSDD